MGATPSDDDRERQIRKIERHFGGSRAWLSWYNKGVDELAADDPNSAAASFERSIHERPEFIAAWINLAGAYLAQDRPADAVAALERAKALNPDFAEIHVNLGLAYMTLGEMDKAIASLERGLYLNQLLTDAHLHLGQAFLAVGRIDEAIEEDLWAVAQRPEFPVAYYNLARAYASRGDWSQARSNARKASELGFEVPDEFSRELDAHN